MRDILKFAGIFVACYFLCLLLYKTKIVSSIINKQLRSYSVTWLSTMLPSVDISEQNLKNKSDTDPEMYIVYGNPILIQKAKEDAKRSGQAYATLPTKSMELHLFEMFIVPLFFIISLFAASPMEWKNKLMGMGITILSIFIFISLKLIILSTFEISNARIGIYEIGESGMKALSTLLGVFSLGFTLMLSFVLWLFFGFRKSKFVDLFNTIFKNV